MNDSLATSCGAKVLCAEIKLGRAFARRFGPDALHSSEMAFELERETLQLLIDKTLDQHGATVAQEFGGKRESRAVELKTARRVRIANTSQLGRQVRDHTIGFAAEQC